MRELPQAGSPLTGRLLFCTGKPGARTASACSPLTGGSFPLNLSGGFAVCGRRDVAAPAAGAKGRTTCGFPSSLNSYLPLFDSPTKIGERRPLRNRGTAEDFFFRVFRNLFAVPDTVLLHMWFHLRKRGMIVPRNSLTRYTARHPRIRRLVQFYLRRCCLSQRAHELRGTAMPRLRRLSGLCSSTLSVNCEYFTKDTLRYPDCRSLFRKRSHVGNLRQA